MNITAEEFFMDHEGEILSYNGIIVSVIGYVDDPKTSDTIIVSAPQECGLSYSKLRIQDIVPEIEAIQINIPDGNFMYIPLSWIHTPMRMHQH